MKKSFINDVFRIGPACLGGFIVLLAWILYIVEPHLLVLIVFSIFSLCWFIWLICIIWTGRLTRITVYADRIEWHRHFKTRTISIDDIIVKKVIPVRRHQWCMLIISDCDFSLYMGLTNSRHIAKLIDILQPSRFTEILKEEKKKCDDWKFNATI